MERAQVAIPTFVLLGKKVYDIHKLLKNENLRHYFWMVLQ